MAPRSHMRKLMGRGNQRALNDMERVSRLIGINDGPKSFGRHIRLEGGKDNTILTAM
ncbi:hypothetical protein BDN71DRAFT_1452270 [Pleurotus eryngii]|uniref:Uncharacterized protein n=1 Tax=Pleurotus eryngii TaxID=5323 RepID=A0A9P5ZPG1_PLEER|nr:hypothetical protein BDN71DRAFT_1452270 [Pleurotus eryngii]